MDEFYRNKFPNIYNEMTDIAGDRFYPYTSISNVDDGIYQPEYGARHNNYTKVIKMSPDDYIEKAYKGFYGRGKLIDGSELKMSQMVDHRLADNSFKRIMGKILNGEKLWMPSLSYNGKDFRQEGLHRVLALKKLGIKEIPVAVHGSKLRNVITKALRFGGNILRTAPLAEFSIGVDYYPQFDLILEKDPKEYSKKYNKYMNIEPGQPGYMNEEGYLNY